MKFKYIGRCAKGEVVFTTPDGPLVMPYGEPVEVPDSLAKKLAANNHFEAEIGEVFMGGTSDDPPEVTVLSSEVGEAPKRRGRPRKVLTDSQESEAQ